MRAIHWFRSDLRLRDNTALAAAASRADALGCVFVFDDRLLEGPARSASRLRFLLGCLERLARDLTRRGHVLWVRRGDPAREIARLLEVTRAELLSFNRDPGPYARTRDARVRAAAQAAGVEILERKDRVIFAGHEIRTRSGTPYRAYPPYGKAWLERMREDRPLPAGPLRLPQPLRLPRGGTGRFPSADQLGIAEDRTEIPAAGETAARRRLDRFLDGAIGSYHRRRDLPATDGTSRLSPYLRLGVLSVRSCVEASLDVAAREPRQAAGARCWLDELIWREFYSAILEAHPHVLRRAYREEYERVRWNDDETGFEAWCQGRTGYPFVDAAMRQLEQTGWMHNRARMATASFLTKDLLIDWRRGERFFMQRLVDGDPASNNGGWQWSASTGTDAQPYFRIFNPVSQGERFDPQGRYVRRFLPELRDVPDRYVHRPWQAPHPPADYPRPIVDHAQRRRQALERFEAARRTSVGR